MAALESAEENPYLQKLVSINDLFSHTEQLLFRPYYSNVLGPAMDW